MINDVLTCDAFFYIFGTGERANELFSLLDSDEKKRIVSFVVSDGHRNKELFNGIRILELSECTFDPSTVFLFAISQQFVSAVYFDEVFSNARKYIVDDEDLKWLRRRKRVDTNIFLSKTYPVSRLFGLDRGTPIDRFYIEKFLEKESKGFCEAKTILEVSENTYSIKYFPNSVHDVLDYDKGMDLTKPESIRHDYYDLFICTQTFNFIYDINSAIRGSYNLLTPGGTMLATVAGNISQISKYDMDRWGDYWRFTYLSIRKLIEDVYGNKVEVFPYGNSMAATAFIQGMCCEEVDVGLLDECDPEYAIVIGIVAQK